MGNISYAIQKKTAEDAGYSLVREFQGHGVGSNLHEEPSVPNRGKQGTGPILKKNMVIAIEPMVNMGKVNVVTDEKNGWEVSTADGLPSAQWEIQVLVTEDGHEVISW